MSVFRNRTLPEMRTCGIRRGDFGAVILYTLLKGTSRYSATSAIFHREFSFMSPPEWKKPPQGTRRCTGLHRVPESAPNGDFCPSLLISIQRAKMLIKKSDSTKISAFEGRCLQRIAK